MPCAATASSSAAATRHGTSTTGYARCAAPCWSQTAAGHHHSTKAGTDASHNQRGKIERQRPDLPHSDRAIQAMERPDQPAHAGELAHRRKRTEIHENRRSGDVPPVRRYRLGAFTISNEYQSVCSLSISGLDTTPATWSMTGSQVSRTTRCWQKVPADQRSLASAHARIFCLQIKYHARRTEDLQALGALMADWVSRYRSRKI